MTEIWKDIKGYESMYQVSSFGNVRSLTRKSSNGIYKGRMLKPAIIGRGYLKVLLSKNNKQKMKMVHRLVAETFLPNPSGKKFVNHIDGDKTNNNVSNLEWCTAKENTHHANINGLTNHKTKKNIAQAKINVSKAYADRITQVIQTDCSGAFIAEYDSISQAAKATGVDRRKIGECVRGVRHMAGGYMWMRKE